MRILPIKLLIAAAMAAISLQACDEEQTIGGSIVDDDVQVFIDTTFVSTATTVDNSSVLSRTVTALLGSIDTEEYGSLSSDFVTQFMPAISIDTTGLTDRSIDKVSLKLRYALDGFVGDSVAPMGLEIYPLTKQLPTPIYSNFNPEGYYDKSKLMASAIYTACRSNKPDSIKELSYGEIEVALPLQLGRDFFNEYKRNPAIFSSPTDFAKFFPGLYIKNSYGSGRVMRIVKTTIDMVYHRNEVINERDTLLYDNATYFAVTPEIVCNNNIDYELSADLKKRRAEGQALLVSPAGYEVELKFPAREIIARYKQNVGSGLGVLNSLTYEIPAEEIANKYNIAPPPNILMVLKTKKDEFFAQNKITDSKTSFYAEYNSATKKYSFGSMRDYILDLIDKGEITEDDFTFIITPVLVSTETNSDYYNGTTTYVTSITPYVFQPVMVRLLVDKARAQLTCSRQTLAK